jgi:hypothetical protein
MGLDLKGARMSEELYFNEVSTAKLERSSSTRKSSARDGGLAAVSLPNETQRLPRWDYLGGKIYRL